MMMARPFKEIESMMLTTFDKGGAKGFEEGQRKAAHLLLEQRFGPLNKAALRRREALPAERLNDLLLAILDAPSLQALGLAGNKKQL